MNRAVTNVIRRIMDTYVPLVLRDNYYVMLPFYLYWFGGSPDIDVIMNFKQLAYTMTDEDFANVYRQLHCRATARPTDCSEETLQWVIKRLASSSPPASLLDVGCGRGYCLERFLPLGFELTGSDIARQLAVHGITFVEGSVERLPFADKSFDIITCFHTLEHVRGLARALVELRRVARKHVYIIVPKQRYFRYTLDLHLHFFYSAAYFAALVDEKNCEYSEVGGDIVYHAVLA